MRWFGWFLIFLCMLWAGALTVSGNMLVEDDVCRCDAVLIVAGESDLRLEKGLQLLREGSGRHLFVDVENHRDYGVLRMQQAQRYFASKLKPSQFTLCEVKGDSTWDEAREVGPCLARMPQYHSILLVTHDFHSRRAQMAFQSAIPDVRFSVAAVRDEFYYQPQWWRTRESAKTWLEATVRMIWFLGVDRWNL